MRLERVAVSKAVCNMLLFWPPNGERTMFEKYTEKARRAIFFARYKASEFGSPCIETEHLLLGLLREDKALTNRFLPSAISVTSIRPRLKSILSSGKKFLLLW